MEWVEWVESLCSPFEGREVGGGIGEEGGVWESLCGGRQEEFGGGRGKGVAWETFSFMCLFCCRGQKYIAPFLSFLHIVGRNYIFRFLLYLM